MLNLLNKTKKNFNKYNYILNIKNVNFGYILKKLINIIKNKNINFLILNTNSLKFIKKKFIKKNYFKHTGFPGGFKKNNFLKIFYKNPNLIINFFFKKFYNNKKIFFIKFLKNNIYLKINKSLNFKILNL